MPAVSSHHKIDTHVKEVEKLEPQSFAEQSALNFQSATFVPPKFCSTVDADTF